MTIEELKNTYGENLVNAIVDVCTDDADEIERICEYGEYTIWNARDDKELGENLAEELYAEEIEKCGFFADYIDYEKLGREYRYQTMGGYTKYTGNKVFLEIIQ